MRRSPWKKHGEKLVGTSGELGVGVRGERGICNMPHTHLENEDETASPCPSPQSSLCQPVANKVHNCNSCIVLYITPSLLPRQRAPRATARPQRPLPTLDLPLPNTPTSPPPRTRHPQLHTALSPITDPVAVPSPVSRTAGHDHVSSLFFFPALIHHMTPPLPRLFRQN